MSVKRTLAATTAILIGTATVLGSLSAVASAQDVEPIEYPHDVLTFYTHSSPGGGSDVFLREMSQYLSEVFGGIDIVVENVRGGSGANALAQLAEQPADGSVFYATTPTFIFTTLLSDLEVGYQDVQPLVNVFYDPQIFYTRADAPWDTLGELLEHANENRSAWGGTNPGSLETITLQQLNALTGVEAAVVTSEGGGETLINVLNGTFDVAIGEVQELRSQIEGGEIKLLAVASEERLETLPDLPTVTESGVDLVVRKFRGLAGPKGLSDDIIAIWEEAIPRLHAHPEYREVYTGLNLAPGFIPNDEYTDFIAEFGEQNRTFLVEAGVISE